MVGSSSVPAYFERPVEDILLPRFLWEQLTSRVLANVRRGGNWELGPICC